LRAFKGRKKAEENNLNREKGRGENGEKVVRK